jgi:hypothetical protein
MKRILLLLLASAGSLASAQEERLIDRVTGAPDPEKASAFQDKKFESASDLKIRAAQGIDRDVSVDTSFDAGTFKQTRSFLGIKNPWFGSKVLDTKAAGLASRQVLKNVNTEVDVKGITEPEALLEQTQSADAKAPYSTKPAEVKGTAQGSIDSISNQVSKDMSVEDLRELLNKK